VTSVTDVRDGVCVRLAAGADVAGLIARMRCHHAFARAHAFPPDATCTLYMPGIVIRSAERGTAIDLLARDGRAIQAIRRHVRSQTDVAAPRPR
jgi:hypothetical protein